MKKFAAVVLAVFSVSACAETSSEAPQLVDATQTPLLAESETVASDVVMMAEVDRQEVSADLADVEAVMEENEEAVDTTTLLANIVASTPKGELKNPYDPFDAAIAAEGKEVYMSKSCNGCHGGTGGGGMCPPLTNQRWVYGKDPDTLFRLISVGSQGLWDAGYERIAKEKVVGPMPALGMVFESEDELWKVVTWILSLHNGK